MGRNRKRWANGYARRGVALHALLRKVTAQTRRREAKKRLFAGRDQVPCCFCGKQLGFKEATIEHVRPLSRGGTWEMENLRISCSPCNSARGNMGYEKFRGRRG
ncbi:MAG: HNH endonuclease [Myxococcales bacterium]